LPGIKVVANSIKNEDIFISDVIEGKFNFNNIPDGEYIVQICINNCNYSEQKVITPADIIFEVPDLGILKIYNCDKLDLILKQDINLQLAKNCTILPIETGQKTILIGNDNLGFSTYIINIFKYQDTILHVRLSDFPNLDNVSVKGLITRNNLPLPNMQIMIGYIKTKSDNNGLFEINSIEPGTYSAKCFTDDYILGSFSEYNLGFITIPPYNTNIELIIPENKIYGSLYNSKNGLLITQDLPYRLQLIKITGVFFAEAILFCDGHFEIDGLKNGRYYLIFIVPGYDIFSLEILFDEQDLHIGKVMLEPLDSAGIIEVESVDQSDNYVPYQLISSEEADLMEDEYHYYHCRLSNNKKLFWNIPIGYQTICFENNSIIKKIATYIVPNRVTPIKITWE